MGGPQDDHLYIIHWASNATDENLLAGEMREKDANTLPRVTPTECANFGGNLAGFAAPAVCR